MSSSNNLTAVLRKQLMYYRDFHVHFSFLSRAIFYIFSFLTREANLSKQTWFSIKFGMELLFPKDDRSFLQTDPSSSERETVGGTRTLHLHPSASFFLTGWPR